MGLRPLPCWDCGFEFRRRHGCLSVVNTVCCQEDFSVSGRSLIQRSPTERSVSEGDREAFIMRRIGPLRGCWAMEKMIYTFDNRIDLRGSIKTCNLYLKVFLVSNQLDAQFFLHNMFIWILYMFRAGTRGGAVGWGTALQAGRSRVRFPMVSLDFFHWHNPSSRTMVLGSTQPLTEMSTRNVSWG